MFGLPGIVSFYLVNFYLVCKNVKQQKGNEDLLYDGSTINLGISSCLFVLSYLIMTIDNLFPYYNNFNTFLSIVVDILSPAMINHFISGTLFGVVYIPLHVYNLRKKYKRIKEAAREKDKTV